MKFIIRTAWAESVLGRQDAREATVVSTPLGFFNRILRQKQLEEEVHELVDHLHRLIQSVVQENHQLQLHEPHNANLCADRLKTEPLSRSHVRKYRQYLCEAFKEDDIREYNKNFLTLEQQYE